MAFPNDGQRSASAPGIPAYPCLAAHDSLERLCRLFHCGETIGPCRKGLNVGYWRSVCRPSWVFACAPRRVAR